MINREPIGKVIFKDGHEEPIVFYRMFTADYVHFFTESEHYTYEEIFEEIEGYRSSRYLFHKHSVFFQYDHWEDEWRMDNSIKCIELY